MRKTPEIAMVKLSAIDPNPMRQLATYPYNTNKLASLRLSIRDIGLWEGVIGRSVGNRVQIAFGHHRVEAARLELGDAEVPVIMRQLSDEDMLKLMGRENMEEYNADFLVLLETWEAAEKFAATEKFSAPIGQQSPTDIARLLGWMRDDGHGRNKPSHAASACAAASELLREGYFQRSDLLGLTMSDAENVVQGVISHQRTTEKTAHIGGYTAEEVAEAKRIAAKAGIATADDVRAGRIAKRDVRGTVDVHAHEFGLEVTRKAPLFEAFAGRLTSQITRLANTDAVAKKLQIIANALNADVIEMEEDIETVKRVGIECRIASERLAQWQQTLRNPPKPQKKIGSRS